MVFVRYGVELSLPKEDASMVFVGNGVQVSGNFINISVAEVCTGIPKTSTVLTGCLFHSIRKKLNAPMRPIVNIPSMAMMTHCFRFNPWLCDL